MANISIHVKGAPTVTVNQLADGRRWIYLRVDEHVTIHLFGEDGDAAVSARAWATALIEAAAQVDSQSPPAAPATEGTHAAV